MRLRRLYDWLERSIDETPATQPNMAWITVIAIGLLLGGILQRNLIAIGIGSAALVFLAPLLWRWARRAAGARTPPED